MMIEPQKLSYVTTDAPGPCVLIQFPEHTKQVYLPVGKVIHLVFSSSSNGILQ